MAEIQRRVTSNGDLGTRERRKSGIFFFNRSFKKSTSYTKGEADSPASSPTTPTLGPAKDFELKRTASGHSIPALAQTSTVNAEAEGVLSASPKTASTSLGEATQKPSDSASLHAKSPEAVSNEEQLPTPPQTPGHSSVEAATSGETGEQDEAAPLSGEAQAEEAPKEADAPEVKKVSYHTDADLDIKVRESDGVDAIYAVRSCVLESASSVWKQGLSTQPSTTTLDLTCDPASGLDAVFSIAHYRFQAVPPQVSEDQLHDIALVAGKYQTLHLLFPFAKGWLAALDSPARDADRVLVTGWTLGHVQWFSQALAQCANAASVSPSTGTVLNAQGRPWAEQPVSQDVVDLIAATRAAAIERIIQAVSTPMNKLLNPELYPSENTRYCHSAAEEEDEAVREECEQLQLGSAIMGLTKARLWPAPEPSRIRVSPVELARAYREVRVRRYQTPGLRFQEDGAKDGHARCGLGHHEQIEAILGEPAVLSAGMVEDLAARAKQSGVYSDGLFAGFESVLGEEPAPAPAPAAVIEEDTVPDAAVHAEQVPVTEAPAAEESA